MTFEHIFVLHIGNLPTWRKELKLARSRRHPFLYAPFSLSLHYTLSVSRMTGFNLHVNWFILPNVFSAHGLWAPDSVDHFWTVWSSDACLWCACSISSEFLPLVCLLSSSIHNVLHEGFAIDFKSDSGIGSWTTLLVFSTFVACDLMVQLALLSFFPISRIMWVHMAISGVVMCRISPVWPGTVIWYWMLSFQSRSCLFCRTLPILRPLHLWSLCWEEGCLLQALFNPM